MKKSGIINVQLAGLIAGLGHNDIFLITDGGMPIPKGVELVDLALRGGVPSFQQVMDAVCDEVVIEGYILANEIVKKNPVLYKYIDEKLIGADVQMIEHTELKDKTKEVKFAIRTGEFTPYPNIIIRAGVAFLA